MNSNTTLEAAWAAMPGEYTVLYERHATVFGWPKLTFGPLWAYWFAKCIIGDEWPLAESMIYSDMGLRKPYKVFLNLLDASRMRRNSLGESEHQRLLAAQMARRTQEKAIPRLNLNQEELERLADSISNRLKIFKDKLSNEELVDDLYDDY